jgi:hypothetical protein
MTYARARLLTSFSLEERLMMAVKRGSKDRLFFYAASKQEIKPELDCCCRSCRRMKVGFQVFAETFTHLSDIQDPR